ncbi:MAG TPA: hypothetical protein PKD53_08890 [Chloroflexaceae bacterium]|nr:hypothetical protein [Chloroflexaceae bacterium]
MKLAEALVERKAAQQKLAELNERLQRVAVVQEGERPAEEPAALLAELGEVAGRLEGLIVAINHPDGLPHMTLWSSLCMHYEESHDYLSLIRVAESEGKQ